MKFKVLAGGFFRHIIFICLGIITLFPIYYIVTSCFKSKQEYIVNMLGIPRHFTLIHFFELFQKYDFARWMLNSFIVTASSVILGACPRFHC